MSNKKTRKCIDCAYFCMGSGVELDKQSRERIKASDYNDSSFLNHNINCHLGLLPNYLDELVAITKNLKPELNKGSVRSKMYCEYTLDLECPIPRCCVLKDKWEKYSPNIPPAIVEARVKSRRNTLLSLIIISISLATLIYLLADKDC